MRKDDQLQRLYPKPTEGISGAVLAYLGPLCLIPYFSRRDHFTRHHTKNGMLLLLAGWPCALIAVIVFSTVKLATFQSMRLWGLLSLFLLAYLEIDKLAFPQGPPPPAAAPQPAAEPGSAPAAEPAAAEEAPKGEDKPEPAKEEGKETVEEVGELVPIADVVEDAEASEDMPAAEPVEEEKSGDK